MWWLKHIKKWSGQLRLKSEINKVTRNLFNNLNPSIRAITRHYDFLLVPTRGAGTCTCTTVRVYGTVRLYQWVWELRTYVRTTVLWSPSLVRTVRSTYNASRLKKHHPVALPTRTVRYYCTATGVRTVPVPYVKRRIHSSALAFCLYSSGAVAKSNTLLVLSLVPNSSRDDKVSCCQMLDGTASWIVSFVWRLAVVS